MLRKRVLKCPSDLPKDHSIPEKPTQHIANATIFCNHLAKFMLPKRRFWKAEQRLASVVLKGLSMSLRPNLKRLSQMFVRSSKIFVREHKVVTKGSSIPENQPNTSLLSVVSSCQVYGPQMKILEGNKPFSVRFPQPKILKAEQTFQSVFSKHFSKGASTSFGYKTLKSTSNSCSERFVRPSKSSVGEHEPCKIFVWEA